MMPSLRKLSLAEIAALHQPALSARAQAVREYDAYLADCAAGDCGRVELADGERRAVVRGRLQAAARRRCLALRFRPGPSSALIFHVEAAPPPLARPVPTPAAGADQGRTGVTRRNPAPPRLPRRRQTPTERYQEMLPRWMRDGQQGGRRTGSKRRTR
jgi:hypothetical protein